MVNFQGLPVVNLHEPDAYPSLVVVLDRRISGLVQGLCCRDQLSVDRVTEVVPKAHVRPVDMR